MAWTSDSTGRWAKRLARLGRASRGSSASSCRWTFPGEETGGIEAAFDDRGGQTTLHVESVEADGSPRDFYATTAVVVGPGPRAGGRSTSSRSRPGVYEAPLGEIDPGAYAVRVTQTRPGSSPLGRTVGLVAPTAAEYRLLGANEPFLAALRTATGGGEVVTPLDPWRHDLRTTSRSTDLWPLLLVLALLLWPLDIALRRVSIGRREFAAAGAGSVASRTPAAGPRARTAAGEGLLAARERATSVGRAGGAARQDSAAACRGRGGRCRRFRRRRLRRRRRPAARAGGPGVRAPATPASRPSRPMSPPARRRPRRRPRRPSRPRPRRHRPPQPPRTRWPACETRNAAPASADRRRASRRHVPPRDR